jgi:hypothetical protein
LKRLTAITMIVLAATISGSLAGCTTKAPDAVTVSGATPAETISDTSAPEPAESSSPTAAVPEQITPLTKAQVTAALPTAKEMKPKGWKLTKASKNPAKSKDKVSPPSCESLFSQIQPTLGKAVASAERDFQASALGPFVSVTISSYDKVPAAGAFSALAAAMSSCKTFTSTNAKGVKTKVTVAPLKFPNLGDQTFAERLTLRSRSGGFNLTFIVDVALATKGANAVAVLNAGLGKLSYASATLTTMKTALAKLPG